MARLIRRPISVLSLLLLAATLAVVIDRASRPAEAKSVSPPPAPLTVPVLRAGLSGQALASAGVSSSQVGARVDAFKAEWNLNPTRLDQADASSAALRSSSDALRRKIEGGLASPQEVSQYQTQMASLAAAEAERTDALGDLFKAAAQGLDAANVTSLQRIRANASWNVPIEFLVVDRTQADWVKLRDALSNERICAKHGDAPNAQLQSFLSSCRAQTEVAAAKSAFDANQASVQTALASALAQ